MDHTLHEPVIAAYRPTRAVHGPVKRAEPPHPRLHIAQLHGQHRLCRKAQPFLSAQHSQCRSFILSTDAVVAVLAVSVGQAPARTASFFSLDAWHRSVGSPETVDWVRTCATRLRVGLIGYGLVPSSAAALRRLNQVRRHGAASLP